MRQNLYQACISATEQSITSRAATYNRAIVTARYPLYGGRRNSMKTSIIHKYIIFLISRSARKIVRFVVCNPTAVNSLRIGRRLGEYALSACTMRAPIRGDNDHKPKAFPCWHTESAVPSTAVQILETTESALSIHLRPMINKNFSNRGMYVSRAGFPCAHATAFSAHSRASAFLPV
jgi:hypothetical protein